MRIFLVGFMGCGKSSWGKRLAKALDFPFYDTDILIENQEGKTIPQLFEEEGEIIFREKESQLLRSFPFPEDSVIATGGGMPCHFENMKLMNSIGFTIYLRMSSTGLANRLMRSKIERPLIEGKDPLTLADYIAAELTKREIFYNQSCLIVHPVRDNVFEVATNLKTLKYFC